MAPEAAVSSSGEGLETLKGVGPKTAEALAAAGFKTVEDLKKASADDLLAVKGIGKKTVEKIMETLKGGAVPDSAEEEKAPPADEEAKTKEPGETPEEKP